MYVYKEKIRQSSFEPGSSAEMNGHGGEPAIHGYCSWYRYIVPTGIQRSRCM